MSVSLLPQELIDEVVDILADGYHSLSGCLGASKIFRSRARSRTFNEIEFSAAYSKKDLETRFKLLSEIIAAPSPASSTSQYVPNAGSLIKILSITINRQTEGLLFDEPNEHFLHIIDTISNEWSNLETVNLLSLRRIESVSPRFGLALTALLRAPKLRTLGLDSIPFGKWEQINEARIESLYVVNSKETTGRQEHVQWGHTCCSEPVLFNIGNYGCESGDAHDLLPSRNFRRPLFSGLRTLTCMVFSASFFCGVKSIYENESPQQILPSLVKAIVYFDTTNSFPVVSWALGASHDSLEELELHFRTCTSILDSEGLIHETSSLPLTSFSLHNFSQVRYLTLSVPILRAPLTLPPTPFNSRHTIHNFLSVYVKVLRDFFESNCPLKRVKLILDWNKVPQMKPSNVLMHENPFWKEFDDLLNIMITSSAHDLKVLLHISMARHNYFMNTAQWKQAVQSSVPLPRAWATAKFAVLSPAGDERPGEPSPAKVMEDQRRVRNEDYFLSHYMW